MTTPVFQTKMIEERVLVLTLPGTEPPNVPAALTEAGFNIHKCASIDDFCGGIEGSAGAGVIAQQPFAPADFRRLIEVLSHQPAWSDFPLVILTNNGDDSEASWEMVHALHPVGHVTLLDRPVHPLRLFSAVEVALRARRRQYEVRDALEERSRAEQALRASQQFLQQTLDSLSAHIAILDASGVIVAVNSAWRRFAMQNGLETDVSCLGINYLKVCDAAAEKGVSDAKAAAAGIRAVAAGQAQFSLEYPCHAPSEQRWFMARVTRFEIDGRVWVVVAHENITVRKRIELQLQSLNETLEDRVAERTAMLKLLRDVASAANYADSFAEALEYVLVRVCEHNGWSFGHVYRPADDNPEELVAFKISHSNYPERFENLRRSAMATRLKHHEGLPGRVFAEARPVWTTDIEDELSRRRIDDARNLGVKTALAFPVLAGDAVVAVLECFSDDTIEPDQDLLDSMASIGAQLGRVIERKQLEKEIADLTDRERRRIGQELHDNLGQQITGLAMLAKSLQQKLESESSPDAKRIAELTRGMQEAQTQVRALAKGLSPVEVDAEGLMNALQELVARSAARSGVECAFHCERPVHVHDNQSATHLYHLTQEAVTNALKHAEARRIVVELEGEPGRVVLRVRDDGKGLPASMAEREGMGMRTMRYRANLIGASLEFEAAEGGGTVVTCVLYQYPARRRNGAAASTVLADEDSRITAAEEAETEEADSRIARILIVDDHPMVRYALGELIMDEADLEVCGEADDVPSALREIEQTRPDLVIVDLSLKTGSGLDLIEKIKARDGKIKMLVSSMHDESLYGERALRAGAMGYVSKVEAMDSVVEAIREVLAGRVYRKKRGK